MAKPLSLPRWANVSGAIVVPISGKQDVGFVSLENPPPEYFNWLFNLNYQWASYLNDGLMEGAFSFNSTVTVTGGIILGANSHVTLGGTGLYKHAARIVGISSAAFQVSGPASLFATGVCPEHNGDSWSFVGGISGKLVATVPLEVGKRVTNIKWFFNKVSNASAITMKLRKKTGGTAAVDLSSTVDATAGASFVSINTGTINYTMEADFQVWLEVTAGNSAHIFGYAMINYDQP